MIYLELAKRFWPFILAIVLFGTGYGYGHHNDHKAMQAKQDALQQEFAVFKADVQAQAIIAQKASDATKAKQEKEKQDADQDYNVRIAALDADVARLRKQERDNPHYLPAPKAASSSPARACVSRPITDGAIGEFVEEVQGITKQGRIGIEKLDSAKIWAASKEN